ncbi:hypothetical protein BCR39DRAFT_544613 [Naematelia encephala]|uniref:Postreplication repair E3 ubiquitin-protein ligase RAD18 n=1 Tax=Naematelia encephala TaxID=71784 RepID=A0A1Y2ASS0_9TREE|nr:hypothetical protein BCR39DRAFT_544613 [Naematelia encephala]
MDMSNHPLLALATDEPPPFPASYPQLQRLDRSIVCPICKEPFSAPVSIACGHSFCSHCIRGSMEVTKKCPVCHESVSEGSIRRNRALEEITDAWDEARPSLIKLSQPPAGPSRKRPPPQPISNDSSLNSLPHLKRRRDSGSRSQSPTKLSTNNHNEAVEFFGSSEEEETSPRENDTEELTEHDEGTCPICSAKMPIVSIPMHIERGCPPIKAAKKVNGSGNQKADWKKVFAGAGKGREKDVEMKRIVKPNYHLSSEKDLRNILSEHGLVTTGDKETLSARVQQWIILFNANLDTSHPKSLSALRAQLTEAEASRKRDKERGKEELGKELETKEGMAKYAKERRGEFERLRKEIMERDKRRAGAAVDTPIEVD